jgi:hypothetical protein
MMAKIPSSGTPNLPPTVQTPEGKAPAGCPVQAGTSGASSSKADGAPQEAVDPFDHSEGIPKEYRERVNADKIPCPALLSLYNNGDLKPAPDGSVDMKALDQALGGLGLGASVRSALVKVADGTDKMPDSFNLFNLRDSNIDHSGSTGIRDPKVDPEKLDTFLSFGSGGRFYADNLAKAMDHFKSIDPGFKGTAIETVEMSALLQVFGRVDPDRGGERYFNNDDIKGLWLDGKYPHDWKPRPTNDVSLAEVGFVGAKIGVFRIWDAIVSPIKNFFNS